MKRTFGQVLRDIRRSRGVSQRELAERVSVDFSYISKIENDRIPPPAADTIVKICKELDVSPDGMLALTGKMPTDVKNLIGSNPTVMQFIRNAQSMELTEDEWEEMSKHLKKLRE